ncbi:MAG: hypothetical protein RLZZ518_757 [Actinomycetota bacterium]|jgi:hypothetical protein
MNSENTSTVTPNSTDPVVMRRNRIDRLNKIASRTGYGMYALSVLSFFGGLWTSLTGPLHFISGATLIIGSVILAPSIVITYGIRAARRDDAASSQPTAPVKPAP